MRQHNLERFTSVSLMTHDLKDVKIGDVKGKRIARFRGVAGVAVAVVAILWPGQTAYIAVEFS